MLFFKVTVLNLYVTIMKPEIKLITAFPWLSAIYPLSTAFTISFTNSLSTFSIERVSGIPLWDFCASNFQRALKIIIIAELFIVMTISPG